MLIHAVVLSERKSWMRFGENSERLSVPDRYRCQNRTLAGRTLVGPRAGLLLTATHAFCQTGFPVGHHHTESALQLGIRQHRITRPAGGQRVLLGRDGLEHGYPIARASGLAGLRARGMGT